MNTSDRRTFQRLGPAQIELIRNRINSDRSVNLAEIARQVGISRAMLHYIIRGQHRTTPDKLTRIATLLDLDPKIICA